MESHYEKLNRKLDRLLKEQREHTTHTTGGKQQQFYLRTVNLTNIHFTKEEMDLLDMGLKYFLQKPSATTWTNLPIETEQAIRLLDDTLQDSFHIKAAKKLKQIRNTNHCSITHKRQTYILKNITQKIANGNAIVAKADKGETIVIIHTQKHTNKVYTFLTENNFHTIPQDPTKKDLAIILKTLQQCYHIINRKQIKHLTQKPCPSNSKCATQATQAWHIHKTGYQQCGHPFLQNS